VEIAAEPGLVVEDPTSGYVGAVLRCENGLVLLEDRHGQVRSFPYGPGFWVDGEPVSLVAPRRQGAQSNSPAGIGADAGRPGSAPAETRTASGSRRSDPAPAKLALPSRIYVEGRHDAELVEKVWGEDLRHVGVVVEYLGGIDDLPGIVAEFAPRPGRRLGVLVDHLVPGSKESRIAAEIAGGKYGRFVLCTGHPFTDIWQAVKPATVGIAAWPAVPRQEDWKTGTCRRLGWPYGDQTSTAGVWQAILGQVQSWNDLERSLLTEVERLIDFVTQDHLETD